MFDDNVVEPRFGGRVGRLTPHANRVRCKVDEICHDFLLSWSLQCDSPTSYKIVAGFETWFTLSEIPI